MPIRGTLTRLVAPLLLLVSLAVLAMGSPRPAQAAYTDDFINLVGPMAQKSAVATGVPASVTIAQAILETGWGNSSLGQPPYNNLFGIKCNGGSIYATGCADFTTKEFINGVWVTITDSFRTYESQTLSVTDHANFLLSRPRYAAAFKYTDNPDQFAREIAKAGYATDPTYADKLIALMVKWDLYSWDWKRGVGKALPAATPTP